MASVISLYPQLNEGILAKVRYEYSEYEFYYTSDDEEHDLKSEGIEGSELLFRLNDERGACNLELDMGMGATKVSATLSGDCDLDMGIGELALTVLGDKADYTIEVNKGVGEYTIDGEKIRDNEKIGNGTNHLQLDGGIGEVKVEFQKAE